MLQNFILKERQLCNKKNVFISFEKEANFKIKDLERILSV